MCVHSIPLGSILLLTTLHDLSVKGGGDLKCERYSPFIEAVKS